MPVHDRRVYAGIVPPITLLVLLLVLVLQGEPFRLFCLGWAFFSAAGLPVLDPLFHRIGLGILTAPSLTALWTGWYNTAWFRLDRLNNTIVNGQPALFPGVAFIPGFFSFSTC